MSEPNEGKTAVAEVDYLNGVAVVFEPDGRIFLLEHDKPEPIDGTGVHLGMYLQPAMNETEQCDAGAYPYAELHQELKRVVSIRRGIDAVVSAVSQELSLKLRCMYAEAALQMIQSEAVKGELTRVFTAKHLPDYAARQLDGLPETFCEFVRPFL